MKCQGCGYNINIEDKFCPHCGRPNDFALEHNESMEKFEEEFRSTKEEVVTNSKRFNSYTGKITIIALLALLICLSFIGQYFSYEIRDNINERNATKKAKEYIPILDEYQENRDIDGFVHFIAENGLQYVHRGQFEKYYYAYNLSTAYLRMEEYIIQLRGFDYYQYNYYTKPEIITNICSQIKTIKNYLDRGTYTWNDDITTGVQGEYMDYVRELTEDTLATYFDLTNEEAASIWELSDAKLGIMLEEKYIDE